MLPNPLKYNWDKSKFLHKFHRVTLDNEELNSDYESIVRDEIAGVLRMRDAEKNSYPTDAVKDLGAFEGIRHLIEEQERNRKGKIEWRTIAQDCLNIPLLSFLSA